MRRSISKKWKRFKVKVGLSKKSGPYAMFRYGVSKNASVSGDIGMKGPRVRGSLFNKKYRTTIEHNALTDKTKLKLKRNNARKRRIRSNYRSYKK